MPRKPPEPDLTVEIGQPNPGVLPWSAYYDTTEDVSELAFPQSVHVYNKMRNDDQLSALLLAFILPILGYRWYVDPNGARDETVEHVANDFGVPIEGQEPKAVGRSRDRFSHVEYLRHSLLKLTFGFSMFEQVYRLGADNKLHVRKLAPRLPGSIQNIQTFPDGGLAYIRQFPTGRTPDPLLPTFTGARTGLLGDMLQGPVIGVDRLVAHVNDKEGGNWYGRPFLRSLYRNWLIKDKLLRVDALKHERNGMGVPTGKSTAGVTKDALRSLLSVVTSWKAGETAAAALPPNTDIELKGVQGSLPDTLASIRYHDEQMARRFVAMFTQLGSTETGSRALGNTFVDFFGLAQEAVAKSYADVTNEHVIEDLVDLNYSIDESAPLLKFRPESDRGLSTDELTSLIQIGAITADAELKDWLRAEHDMPERAEGNAGPQPTSPGQPVPVQTRQRIQASLRRPLNAAAEKRKKSDVEERSKVDFEAIQETFASALADLIDQWKTDVRQSQITELIALIAATAPDDLEALASVQATPKGVDLLTESAQALAETAAEQATKEITDQGIDFTQPDLDTINQLIEDRAAATEVLMARALSQSAANEALLHAGGGLTSTEIAQNVGEHLNSLTDAGLKPPLSGTLTHAQNKARGEVFDAVPYKEIYASELIDTPNICKPCEDVNGEKYATMEAAHADYPDGGFHLCEGGPYCRGTLVCIALDEAPPTIDDGSNEN